MKIFKAWKFSFESFFTFVCNVSNGYQDDQENSVPIKYNYILTFWCFEKKKWENKVFSEAFPNSFKSRSAWSYLLNKNTI